MKILLKNKTNRKMQVLREKENYIHKNKEEITYEDILVVLTCLSCFFLAIGFLTFIVEDFYPFFIFSLTFIVLSIFLTKTKYAKKKKQLQNIKKKIRLKKFKLIETQNTLSISNNFLQYYNELLRLRGHPKMNTIESDLVQEVIEEYRKKDGLNLPFLSNENRLKYFTDNEVNKVKIYMLNETTNEIVNT